MKIFRGISLMVVTLCFSLLIPDVSLLARDGQELEKLRINPERITVRIEELAAFGTSEQGGVSRLAFSEADLQARAFIIEAMTKAGLDVRIDAAGNIIGRREGLNPSLPPILSGSHLDTVPSGGKYDGTVGVISALECAQVLEDHGITTHHPLEVIVFVDEEGGLVGSRAMTGTLTPEALDVISHSGKTVREGIRFLGGDPDNLSTCVLQEGEIKAFIEVHIEQGGTLELEDIDIGVVEGIVGINWWDVTIKGIANHAGTTPMDMRKDALLAAAHLIIAANRVVTGMPGRQVGTVGRIRAEPGVPNVIPGQVVMSLELRDLSADKIQSIFQEIRMKAEAIAEKSGTAITFSPIDATAVPAPTDPAVRSAIAEAAHELGLTFRFMPSGAGHDAQHMAKIVPTGMIFVPSVEGISHSPKEFTRNQDIVNGANVLLHTILKLDSPISLTSMGGSGIKSFN